MGFFPDFHQTKTFVGVVAPPSPHTSADPTSYITKTNMGMFSRKAEAKFDPVAQPRVTVDDFWRAPRANNKQLQRNRMETIVFGARTTKLWVCSKLSRNPRLGSASFFSGDLNLHTSVFK